ncbi:fibronectin type III domain-containing protein [Amycolatopsis sp. NBC_00345]
MGQSPALTATLTSPTDIVLRWPAADPGAAGHRLEYANTPDGPWTTLQFLPQDQTSYTHPNLIPETPFYYRLQPFSGPVSAVVKVESTAPSRPSSAGASTSVRTPGDAAAPTDLHATPGEDTSVVFTWTDHTTDEAGFLLELRKPGATGFTPVEVTDPNTTTCALSLLPGEQGADFRVRALAYGPLSPVVHRTTGKD